MNVLESRAARWVIGFMSAMTLLVAALTAAVVAQFQIAARTEANLRATERAAREAEEGANQSKRNAALLDIVLAITGCTVDDTPRQCSERVRQASANEGNRRIVEVDCRIRLALAGKASPQPGEACQ